ncbi:Acetylxylan esterase precursor [Pseudobythopirellula maris]|uniref:Acetylxylan esterase n=1 Tax=Pseudobythopirellula maris TaxID=2527991 RepID=A0A5C5ZGA4_9BACT|nr:GDSL-type esterase/lipase family protein [Pseudobythopirellula maris]TWT86145.1 Acetylxylan esterase precursor [Pseudobythopirellula maris]
MSPAEEAPPQTVQPLRVACVGASLTFGLGLERRREECYPALLQTLLGDGYHVRNFGYCGATASRDSAEPYIKTPSYTAAVRFEPHITVIMLGTNDAQFAHAAARTDTADGLRSLAEEFLAMPGADPHDGATVLLGTSSPVLPTVAEIDGEALAHVVRPTVARVASDLGLPLIDLCTPLADRTDDFPDGLHPNAAATRIIAETVHRALQGELRV